MTEIIFIFFHFIGSIPKTLSSGNLEDSVLQIPSLFSLFKGQLGHKHKMFDGSQVPNFCQIIFTGAGHRIAAEMIENEKLAKSF